MKDRFITLKRKLSMIHSFFIITTSNFGAESLNVLIMFGNLSMKSSYDVLYKLPACYSISINLCGRDTKTPIIWVNWTI